MSFLSKTFKYVNSLGQSIVFDCEHGYLISKPDGIDTISVTANTAQGIGQVGAAVQSKAIQTRPITINGRVIGDNAQALKDALVTVVRPDLTGVLYAGDWHIDVIVTASPTIGASKRGAPFQLGLLAPYPYWESGERKVMQLRGVQKGFKFPWNISKTYYFGKVIVLKYIVLQNFGQFDVPFMLEINCIGETATNIGIENMLTGEVLRLEKRLWKMSVSSSRHRTGKQRSQALRTVTAGAHLRLKVHCTESIRAIMRGSLLRTVGLKTLK